MSCQNTRDERNGLEKPRATVEAFQANECPQNRRRLRTVLRCRVLSPII